jgi:integrase
METSNLFRRDPMAKYLPRRKRSRISSSEMIIQFLNQLQDMRRGTENGTQAIKKALKDVLTEINAAGKNPIVIPPQQEQPIIIGDKISDEPRISTSEAIRLFSEIKHEKRLKHSTEQTNLKRLKPFADTFEYLPLDAEVIRKEFLTRYAEMSPRYHRNVYDVLVDLYKTIRPKLRLSYNPMDEIDRPQLNGCGETDPHPLNFKWLPALMHTVETDFEMAALLSELGAGWRPIEYMRIRAIDVREAHYREAPLILVRGKERNEITPILPENLKLLSGLTSDLADHELIIRNKRRQPMGAKAHTIMIRGIFRRAGIPASFVPYDLRDTFASWVYEKSGDWFLTERLMRHRLPGEGNRYARYPLKKLFDDLKRFSPLYEFHWIAPPVQNKTTQGGQASSGEGGTRTPMHCCTRS